jgi:hypothetical protein
MKGFVASLHLSRLLIFWATLIGGILFSTSCSFKPAEKTLRLKLALPTRPNPALSALNYFAIAITGGVSNSVESASFALNWRA